MLTKYAVNDIYATVQGEGCQTGLAMVLVRLQGCGVACPWCDTKETWLHNNPATKVDSLDAALGHGPTWTLAPAGAIVNYVRARFPGPRWILLTGGEPAEQPLADLIGAFQVAGYHVALETSGTALGHVTSHLDWLCVSPKIGMPGQKPIEPEALAAADEIKQVIGKDSDLRVLDALINGMRDQYGEAWNPTICLQPVSCSPKATDLCVTTAIARGWRVSLQTHKFAGLR
jgi:7-carboxy-7-deazaguanine synthase